MTIVSLFALTSAVLLAAPAETVRDPMKGAPYTSEDLDARAPGPQWKLNTVVQGAPGVRGVYTLHRDPVKGRNVSSLISFTIENEPDPPEPAKYAEGVLAQLAEPPLSFKRTKADTEITVKGMTGVKSEYTDKDGIRHFTQVCLKLADGRLLLAVLQSPDAKAFTSDQNALREFLDGIVVRPRTRN